MDAKSKILKPWPHETLSEHVRTAPQPAVPRPSREEAEAAVRTLIAFAGDNPGREGVLDTPKRVVDAYEEIFSGYRECPAEVLDRIIAAPDDGVQEVLADAYLAPIREELIARRIEELHAAGSKAAVSATPGIARLRCRGISRGASAQLERRGLLATGDPQPERVHRGRRAVPLRP